MSRRDAFLDHLAQVPLFSALSRKELALVARRAEDVKVDQGRVLVSEGATGSEFFVIIDGKATVSKKGRKIATLESGRRLRRARPARQGTPQRHRDRGDAIEVVVLGQREFGGLIDEVPGFARKLLAGMARRLREADAKSVQ